ncbi:MAG: response regulator [Proteobacteria bacterium]|jgi:two-component system chemotaxis response regulator CheY|nr:response regulator [Pseudomonadota bacterium]
MFAPTTRVLIVDDMSTMRKIVGKTCKELGFSDLTEAADGTLAWEALQSAPAPIGLIISDWNMPNCTGIDLLKRVRADSRFKGVPFILVTAEAEQHQVVEAVKAGVDQYVVKPFTKDDLKTKLEAVYKKYAKS